MPSKKAASLSPEVEKQIVEAESMSTEQIHNLLLRKCWDNFRACKITRNETKALTKAANARLRAIRKELRSADRETIRELIGG